MQNRVYSQELVDRVVDELKITDLEQATIGQVVLLASRLEELTGIPFIRMDQGVPGLEPFCESFSGCRYFGGGLCPGNRVGGRVVRIVHRLYPV